MITVKNLYKTMADIPVLNDVNLNVDAGRIYCLVGPSGSGKTTLLEHMAGVLRPDRGGVFYDGDPIWENPTVKERIGFMPDNSSLLDYYTLREAGKLYRMIYPVWDEKRFSSMTAEFGLDGDRKISSFSKGTRKQAAFILMMSTHPFYILMDEIADGLEPRVRKLIWRYVTDDAAADNVAVIASSHNLMEMEGVCDNIGIIEKGRILAERSVSDMRDEFHKLQVSFVGSSQTGFRYSGLNIMNMERKGSVDILIVKNSRDEIHDWVASLQTAPVIFDVLPLTLEEIFLCEVEGSGDEARNLFI